MEEQREYYRERVLLKMFTSDVEKFDVLTREEEDRLLLGLNEDRPDVMRHLIEANIRFALRVVFQYWRPGLPLMDMVSEACLGLVIAAKRFNPAMGFRLATYAEPAIRQRVIGAIFGAEHKDEESLDRPLYQDGDGTTLKDQLVSDADTPEEEAEKADINKYLEALSDRERKVIELRFWQDKTLDYVGRTLNIHRQRVAQIEARAFLKLRLALKGMEIPWQKAARPL